jgi:hypothetical protein
MREQPPVTKVIQVEKGNPSPEELAAVTAVLLARAAVGTAQDHASYERTQAGPRWRRPERTPRSPGPRSWRA